MPRSFRILLAVVAGLVLVLAGALGALHLWLGRDGAVLERAARRAAAAGEVHGQGATGASCEAEALRRVAICATVRCEVLVKFFLTACLGRARIPGDYCREVPGTMAFARSERFRRGRCAAVGRAGDARCVRLMEAVQDYCEQR